MKVEKFSFLSADKKTPIFAMKCMPSSGKYTKILQIVHGMHEYIEKYLPFIEFLSTQGYMIVGHDQLGHGKSILSLKDWGYFGKNPSDLLVEDIHKLRQMIQKENENENLPYFILGHSMGSFLLRKYLSFYSSGLAGAIIMGTGYTPPYMSRFGIAFAKVIGFFKGGHHFSQFIDDLTSGGEAYKNYDPSGKDPYKSWITKDSKVVTLRNQDPRVIFPFTVNGFLGIFEAVNFSCKASSIEQIDKEIPILLVSGAEDPVGNNGKGVYTVLNMMKNAQIKDVSIKLYENDRHEILLELDKQTVYEDLLSWMEDKISLRNETLC